MTRTKKRSAAARQLVQLAALTVIGSSIASGCSSGVKTVTVECTGGASAFAGSAGSNAGDAGSMLGSGAFNNAGEAGQGGASGEENGGSQAGASGSDENAGNAGSSGAGPGGTTGTAGHAGATSGGMSNGGHGGSAGNNAGAGNAGAAAVAKCGDKITAPPEFCDDGTNTDLSYGCTACTTLTGTRSPPRCSAVLELSERLAQRLLRLSRLSAMLSLSQAAIEQSRLYELFNQRILQYSRR